MRDHVSFYSYHRIGREILLAIVCAFVARGAIGAPPGKFYYVGNGGDDGHLGLSEETAFATLAKAIATANADATADAVVVLSDQVLSAPVEITGAYTLRGRSTNPADTTIAAAAGVAVSPLVKVSNPAATVAHLTLSGGTATETAGGDLWLAGGGVATNCLLKNATGVKEGHGGGVWNDNGTVTHCIVEGGYSKFKMHGAGIYQSGTDAVTAHSVIRNNWTSDRYGMGGGIRSAGGRILDCVISNNMAGFTLGDDGYGGGIYADSTKILNCLIAGNRGGYFGGGIYINDGGNVVSNCTIVGNVTRDRASAVFENASGSKFYNLIIWDNQTIFENKVECGFIAPSTMVFNSLCKKQYGKNPVRGDPGFVDAEAGDYRLSAISSAIGMAADGGDIGYMPFDSGSLSVGIAVLPKKALPPASFTFDAYARGGEAPVSYRWRLDDLNAGTEGTWSDYAAATNYVFELAPGHFRIVVEAKDGAGTTATFSRPFYVGASKVYLVPAGTDGNTPAIPYDTKATAATDIQDAILYCADGTELIAADGDYGVTREVYVPAAVLIRSENGPEKTSIYRIGKRGAGISTRVVYLHGKGATLSGFAVTNGYFEGLLKQKFGTNIAAYEDDTVTNCILSDAVGTKDRRGTCGAAFVNARLYGSVIRDNDVGSFFGGAISLYGAKAHMADCVVTNHFNGSGGYYTEGLGVLADKGALIERCVIRDNSNRAGSNGGGGGGVCLSGSVIRDSLICRNKSGKNGGGGVYARGASKIVNCTIADNESTADGGGLKVCNRNGDAVTVVNTVFHGNISDLASASPGEPSWMNLDGPKSSASHIAVPDALAAIGTLPVLLSFDPFADSAHGDYSLSLESPCRDSGDNGERLAEELDVARQPRIVRGVIDIGAYEFQVVDELKCSFTLSGFDTVGEEVVAHATVDGENLEGLQYRWGVSSAEGVPVFSWTSWNESDVATFQLAPGQYLFSLEARNNAGQTVRAVSETSCRVVAKKIYLVPPEKSLGAPRYPYDSWEHAATNAAMALSAA